MTELSYRAAGVDLELYEQAMQKLPKLMQRTRVPGVMDLPGGFAGLFHLAGMRSWRDPVLVSGTDGVGTKIKVALAAGKFDTIGIDLVAMCVNDCLCLGARPLFFLDYIAMGKDNPDLLEQLVRGVSDGCCQAQAALLGGETAIMPDLYAADDFDMAGFCVAAAERDGLINGKERIRPGDVLIGLPSSGFHSNGYSLIRKVVFEHAGLSPTDEVATLNMSVADALLTPTLIYAAQVDQLTQQLPNAVLHGIAHITGGGIADNLTRILPDGVDARVDVSAWPLPPVISWLRGLADIAADELYRVFNMGLGMVIAVAPEARDAALQALATPNATAIEIGEIVPGSASSPRVLLPNIDAGTRH